MRAFGGQEKDKKLGTKWHVQGNTEHGVMERDLHRRNKKMMQTKTKHCHPPLVPSLKLSSPFSSPSRSRPNSAETGVLVCTMSPASWVAPSTESATWGKDKKENKWERKRKSQRFCTFLTTRGSYKGNRQERKAPVPPLLVP